MDREFANFYICVISFVRFGVWFAEMSRCELVFGETRNWLHGEIGLQNECKRLRVARREKDNDKRLEEVMFGTPSSDPIEILYLQKSTLMIDNALNRVLSSSLHHRGAKEASQGSFFNPSCPMLFTANSLVKSLSLVLATALRHAGDGVLVVGSFPFSSVSDGWIIGGVDPTLDSSQSTNNPVFF